MTWSGDAPDALAHYARQLEAAGWTSVTSGGHADVAAGVWTRDDGDAPLTVAVEVVRTGPTEFSLRLTLASHAG